jgi:drug/metabolite transporter (DMT)-like permease
MGVIFALLSASGFGSSSFFVRLGLLGVRPAPATVFALGISFLFTLILAIIFNRSELFNISLVALGWFALMGFVQFVLGRYSLFVSVNMVGVGRASTLAAISPLVASVLGITLGGESLTPLIGIGTIAIVCGVILVSTARS